MCLQCLEGYNKVGGRCFECPGFDWRILTLSLVFNLLMALFLLFKSTKATASKAEIVAIWRKVDLKSTPGAPGVLDGECVGEVLALLGKHLSTEQLNKTLAKSFQAVPPRFTVRQEDFVKFQSLDSPTAAMGTAIFFVQTFALLAKDASFFGMGSVLNLDAEEASGRCISPLSHTQR